MSISFSSRKQNVNFTTDSESGNFCSSSCNVHSSRPPNKDQLDKESDSVVAVGSLLATGQGQGELSGHNLTSTSISAVAELAARFLEENVRKCIKPRIFPVRFPLLYCNGRLSCTIIFHDIFINFLREFLLLANNFQEEVSLSYSIPLP
jgi:hypothetical protein